MAYAPIRDADLNLTLGQFKEADHGNWFEYSKPTADEYQPFAGYNQKVWVGPRGVSTDQGFRWAKVLQTVAYLVTDEGPNGEPVVEKWAIKNHRRYDR